MYEVIKDVALQDYQLVQEAGGAALTQTRKVFVGGQSLGGFTAALTCLKYGAAPLDTSLPSAAAAAAAADANPGPGDSTGSTSFRPTISGGLFLCPMLAISPDSRPSPLVELAARAPRERRRPAAVRVGQQGQELGGPGGRGGV